MIRTKGKITCFFILFLYMAVSASSAKNDVWLLNINDAKALSINNFSGEFKAFIDMQTIAQVIVDDKSIKEARLNKKNKRTYLESVINDLLIMEYTKSKKIYKEEDIKKRLDAINIVLRKQMIRKYYIDKVIRKKAGKVKESSVRAFYKELKKSKETKGLSALEIRDLARRRARTAAIQRTFLKEIDDLRSKHRIKLNDKYQNLFE